MSLEIRRCPDRPWWRRANPGQQRRPPRRASWSSSGPPHGHPAQQTACRPARRSRQETAVEAPAPAARRCGTVAGSHAGSRHRAHTSHPHKMEGAAPLPLNPAALRPPPAAHRASRTAQDQVRPTHQREGQDDGHTSHELVTNAPPRPWAQWSGCPQMRTTGMAVPARYPPAAAAAPTRTTPLAPGHLTCVRHISSTQHQQPDRAPACPPGRLPAASGSAAGPPPSIPSPPRVITTTTKASGTAASTDSTTSTRPRTSMRSEAARRPEPRVNRRRARRRRPCFGRGHRALPSDCRRPTSTGWLRPARAARAHRLPPGRWRRGRGVPCTTMSSTPL